MKILGIPGSVRKDASSMIVLQTLGDYFAKNGTFSIFEGLNRLPHFDGREVIAGEVDLWHKALTQADALVICSPEYAFGVPGTLKNALDWTVSSGGFVDKPTALVVASTLGEHAFASFKLILSALSAKTDDETSLLISYIRAKITDGKLVDKKVLASLENISKKLADIVREK